MPPIFQYFFEKAAVRVPECGSSYTVSAKSSDMCSGWSNVFYGLRRLVEKVFDQSAFVFVFDAGKQPGAEFSDRFRLIEW